jgi:predicted translin family RNA/ssDNA-binding protein
MIREDFDRIIDKRISCNKFNGKVKIFFSNYAQDQEITLSTAREIVLPSQKAANEIRKMIDAKKNLANEQRSIEELEKKLKEIEEIYHDEDYYEFFELRSHKLNITIINEGDSYIEDAVLLNP